jgi:hypothetical protein
VVAQEAAPYRILVLKMSAAGAVHTIVDSTIVPSPVPLVLPVQAVDGRSLNFAVANAKGQIVAEGSMPNPLEVRSPLSPPGEQPQGHTFSQLPQTDYIIRLPYEPSATTLQISLGGRAVAAAVTGTGSSPPPPGSQTFSLDPWLRAAEAKGATAR